MPYPAEMRFGDTVLLCFKQMNGFIQAGAGP